MSGMLTTSKSPLLNNQVHNSKIEEVRINDKRLFENRKLTLKKNIEKCEKDLSEFKFNDKESANSGNLLIEKIIKQTQISEISKAKGSIFSFGKNIGDHSPQVLGRFSHCTSPIITPRLDRSTDSAQNKKVMKHNSTKSRIGSLKMINRKLKKNSLKISYFSRDVSPKSNSSIKRDSLNLNPNFQLPLINTHLNNEESLIQNPIQSPKIQVKNIPRLNFSVSPIKTKPHKVQNLFPELESTRGIGNKYKNELLKLYKQNEDMNHQLTCLKKKSKIVSDEFSIEDYQQKLYDVVKESLSRDSLINLSNKFRQIVSLNNTGATRIKRNSQRNDSIIKTQKRNQNVMNDRFHEV